MENVVPASPIGNTSRLKDIINSFGPGIMMATASVGGSHLVASTKSGAIYGWQLAAIILLVNLFKYPFFRAAVQYTMGTGKSLIQGYSEMGRGYLWTFSLLMLIANKIFRKLENYGNIQPACELNSVGSRPLPIPELIQTLDFHVNNT